MIRTVNQFFGGTINTGGSLFPNEVAGLEFWYDVSDLGTITKDGSGNVSEIADKSGNLFNLSQATIANQPTWLSAQFKGLDVVRFNSANAQRMLTGYLIDAFDIFIVAKISGVGTVFSLFGAGTSVYYSMDASGTPGAGRYVNRNSTAYVFQDLTPIDTDGGSIYNTTNGPTVGDGSKFYTSQSKLTGTGTAHSINRNFGLGILRLSSSAEYGNFDFLEAFAYNNLVSDQNREKLWNYLSEKYSLTAPTL